MEKQEVKIQINGEDKIFIVKEIKYKDVTSVSKNEPDPAKKMMQLATEPSITDVEYDSLNMKNGVKLQNVINKLNGLDDTDF